VKIAVASDDGKTIAPHFGRTLGFVIYDTDGKAIKVNKYKPNTFTGHALGLEHAGHHHDRHSPILTALADCAVVISHGMGRRLYDDLSAAGIQAIITDQTDARGAVEAYLNGQLEDHPERGCAH
jgi:predicted Fe-Mo cluster-binding NifX family protein